MLRTDCVKPVYEYLVKPGFSNSDSLAAEDVPREAVITALIIPIPRDPNEGVRIDESFVLICLDGSAAIIRASHHIAVNELAVLSPKRIIDDTDSSDHRTTARKLMISKKFNGASINFVALSDDDSESVATGSKAALIGLKESIAKKEANRKIFASKFSTMVRKALSGSEH